MVFVMIPVGLVMTQEIPRAVQDPLFILHKGLGVVVLATVVLRLAWRAFHPAPPPPAAMPALRRRAAAAVHWGLYALLLAMALSGYVRVMAGGFPIELLTRWASRRSSPRTRRSRRREGGPRDGRLGADRARGAPRRGRGPPRADPQGRVFSRMWPPLPRRARGYADQR
jgi:cytochrome b561